MVTTQNITGVNPDRFRAFIAANAGNGTIASDVKYHGDKNNNGNVDFSNGEVTFGNKNRNLREYERQALIQNWTTYLQSKKTTTQAKTNDDDTLIIENFEKARKDGQTITANGRYWSGNGLNLSINGWPDNSDNSYLDVEGTSYGFSSTVGVAPGYNGENGTPIDSRGYNGFGVTILPLNGLPDRSSIELYSRKNYGGPWNNETLTARYWLPDDLKESFAFKWPLPYSQKGHQITKVQWLSEIPGKVHFGMDDFLFTNKDSFRLPETFPPAYEELVGFNGFYLQNRGGGTLVAETDKRWVYNNKQNFDPPPKDGNGAIKVTLKPWKSFGVDVKDGSRAITFQQKDKYLVFKLSGNLNDTTMLKVEVNGKIIWLIHEGNGTDNLKPTGANNTITKPMVTIPLSKLGIAQGGSINKFQILGDGNATLTLDHIGGSPSI